MSWFNILGDAKDLASEYIEDKDKSNKLNAMLEKLGQEVYTLELKTKTIPWVDALHKMSRPIMGLISTVAPVIVLIIIPDIPIEKLLLVMGGSVPTAIYTKLKGKGN